MPMSPDAFDTIKRKLDAYVKGWTAFALLKKSLEGTDSVRGNDLQPIVEAVKRAKPKATVFDVIEQIIKKANASEGIAWDDESGVKTKKLAICLGPEVYTVTIKQPAPELEEYTVDVTGEMQGGLLVVQPASALVGGQTKIAITPGGEYHIEPGEGVPIISDKAREHRPLQLNTVRKFAEKLAGVDEPAHLALLGTGTGKSFVIASAAEAVGSSVIVVPTKDLAKELVNDGLSKKIFGGRIEETYLALDDGTRIKAYSRDGAGGVAAGPYVVLPSEFPPGCDKVATFRELCARTDVHLVLSADEEAFAAKLASVQDKLLLIDESHQHAYTAEQADAFKAICEGNVTLALTGTPTGQLYRIFPPQFVEFNLHDAMQARYLRPVDGKDIEPPLGEEWTKQQMVDKAIVAYFRTVDPETPCQKSMLFSDDPDIRAMIEEKLNSIADGSMDRAEMLRLAGLVAHERDSSVLSDVGGAGVALPNLTEEMTTSRVTSLRNTALSMAVSLLYPKPQESLDDTSLALRDGSLTKKGLRSANLLPDGDDAAKEAVIRGRLTTLSTLGELPATQKEFLEGEIIRLTKALDRSIKSKAPDSNLGIVMDEIAPELGDLDQRLGRHLTGERYVVKASMVEGPMDHTPTERLAMLRCGFANASVSDQRWATGVSITDVKSEVTVNYSVDFEDHNALAAPLAGAQALGRVVRSKDGVGSSTIIWGDKVPPALRFRTSEIMAENFGEVARASLTVWDVARKAYSDARISGFEPEVAYEMACVAVTGDRNELLLHVTPALDAEMALQIAEVDFDVGTPIAYEEDEVVAGFSDEEIDSIFAKQRKIKEGVKASKADDAPSHGPTPGQDRGGAGDD